MELNRDDLPYFEALVLLDEAWRFPAGKRQKEPMNGFWMSGRLELDRRLSDQRLRRNVCIYAIREVEGMSIEKAATRVGVFLGKRTAAQVNVLRIGYYEAPPERRSYDFFVGQFLHLREWVLRVNEETLEYFMEQYQGNFGAPRRRTLATWIKRLRNDPVQQSRHITWLKERAQARRTRIESNHWDPERDRQSLAADYSVLGCLQALIGDISEARSLLKQALNIWKEDGHKLPHAQTNAIAGLEHEIACLYAGNAGAPRLGNQASSCP
jgi:hypothetical protein